MDFTFEVDQGQFATVTDGVDLNPVQLTSITERHSPTFLSIPKWGPDVPFLYASTNEDVFLQLVRILINANLIDEKDISHNPTIEEAINQSIARYFNSVGDTSHMFNLTCHFATFKTDPFEYIEHDHDALEKFHPEKSLYFYLEHQDEVPEVQIGAALDALEAINEGLGQTIWYLIAEASRLTPDVFSLHSILNHYCYELGISEEHLEGEGSDELEEGDETAQERLAAYLHNSPTWMSAPEQCITDDQLQVLVHQNLPTHLKQIIETALMMKNQFTEHCDLGYSNHLYIDARKCLVIIRHSEQDQIMRALDDYDEHINCGLEFSECLHVEMTSLQDEAAFLTWLQKKKAAYQLIVSLGNLLSQLHAYTRNYHDAITDPSGHRS